MILPKHSYFMNPDCVILPQPSDVPSRIGEMSSISYKKCKIDRKQTYLDDFCISLTIFVLKYGFGNPHKDPLQLLQNVSYFDSRSKFEFL